MMALHFIFVPHSYLYLYFLDRKATGSEQRSCKEEQAEEKGRKQIKSVKDSSPSEKNSNKNNCTYFAGICSAVRNRPD
jgi:hypothetical protein